MPRPPSLYPSLLATRYVNMLMICIYSFLHATAIPGQLSLIMLTRPPAVTVSTSTEPPVQILSLLKQDATILSTHHHASLTSAVFLLSRFWVGVTITSKSSAMPQFEGLEWMWAPVRVVFHWNILAETIFQ